MTKKELKLLNSFIKKVTSARIKLTDENNKNVLVVKLEDVLAYWSDTVKEIEELNEDKR